MLVEVWDSSTTETSNIRFKSYNTKWPYKPAMFYKGIASY